MRDVIFKSTNTRQLATPSMWTFGPHDRVIKVGRLATSMLRIEDPSVGRMHAVIERDGDKLAVVDLGAPGGTRVNGKKVGKHWLCDGDRVTFGDVEFEVTFAEGDARRSLDDLMARLGVNGVNGEARDMGRDKDDKDDKNDANEDELKVIQSKIAEVSELASALIKLVEGVKGKLPIADAVRVLRDVVGPELKPLGELLRDMGKHVRYANTHSKAKLVKEIMDQHGLSEEAALCLVVDTQRSMSDTWQMLIQRDKKKPQR